MENSKQMENSKPMENSEKMENPKKVENPKNMENSDNDHEVVAQPTTLRILVLFSMSAEAIESILLNTNADFPTKGEVVTADEYANLKNDLMQVIIPELYPKVFAGCMAQVFYLIIDETLFILNKEREASLLKLVTAYQFPPSPANDVEVRQVFLINAIDQLKENTVPSNVIDASRLCTMGDIVAQIENQEMPTNLNHLSSLKMYLPEVISKREMIIILSVCQRRWGNIDIFVVRGRQCPLLPNVSTLALGILKKFVQSLNE